MAKKKLKRNPKEKSKQESVTTDFLGFLKTAASGKKTIAFEYEDSKGQKTRRETEPYEVKISHTDGIPVLYGYDLMRDEIRMYKFNRIQNPIITGNAFSPRWDLKIPTSLEEAEPTKSTKE